MRKYIQLASLLLLASFVLVACAGNETIQVHITEIVDDQTGEPVQADVFVEGELVSSGVTTVRFEMKVPGKIEVIHPDYRNWSVIVNGKTERTLTGPVKLISK